MREVGRKRGLVFVKSSTVLTITSGFAITTILCRILLLANFKRDETQTRPEITEQEAECRMRTRG